MKHQLNMEHRLNRMDYVAIAFATLLLLFSPMLSGIAVFLLAATGLLGLVLLTHKRFTAGEPLGAFIGFVVALFVVLVISVLRHG